MPTPDPILGSHHRAVSALIRRVAAQIVMPRYRELQPGDVEEKSPGELVTIADRESEAALAAGLSAIDPSARIVGEEACALDPALLDGVGAGRLWLIDPIDGTANFAAGREPFGIMVALVEDGTTLGSWIYDPVSGRLCHAQAGGGAWIDGRPLRAMPTHAARPVASLSTRFMTSVDRDDVEQRASAMFELRPIPGSAATHYPRLVTGDNDIALFQRILPWDHAAGALFVSEAGGIVRHWNGLPYRVGSGERGILAAASPCLWNQAAAILSDRQRESAAIMPARLVATP